MKRKATILGLLCMSFAARLSAQVPTFIKDFYEIPKEYMHIGNTLYFTAAASTGGTELWKSDGTTAGTVLVKDINPGSGGSNPQNLTNLNGILLFRASDGTNGMELWKSDGTAAGTVMVKNIKPGNNFDYGLPSNNGNVPFRIANNKIIFQGDDGINGSELWISDGTANGTVMLKNIQAGLAGSFPDYFTEMGGKVYFAANAKGTNGATFWRTDGTAAGTIEVYNHLAVNPMPLVKHVTRVNNLIYFTASGGTTGGDNIVKSDGTTAGTTVVKALGQYSSAANLCGSGGKLYFSNYTLTEGREAWVSDGTAAGTFMLKDINPGTAWSAPSNFFDLNGTVFFRAETPAEGEELWRSNGTTTGTVLVKDINPGTADGFPVNFTLFNNELYFMANDGVAGIEAWKTDGATAAPNMLFNLGPGYVPGVNKLYATPNTLYFSGNTGFIFSSGLYKVGGLTTGIPELETAEKAVSVYPNPTSGRFRVNLPPGLKIAGFELFTATGHQIYRSEAIPETINLSGQAAGLYFLQLKTDQGLIVRKLSKF